MSSIEENYVALLNLPIVRQLIRKNAKIRKENKALKSLIYSLPEFRCDCRGYSPSIKVEIKKEREDSIPVQCETLEEDDEVVFVAPENETKKINIVYEIDEEEEEEEGEAQAGEEEAGEAQAGDEDKEASEEEDDEEETEEEAGDEEEEGEEEGEEEETPAEEEDAEEVFVVTVSGKSYYTTNKENGKIYKIDADEEIGDEIGEFKDGKAKFYKK